MSKKNEKNITNVDENNNEKKQENRFDSNHINGSGSSAAVSLNQETLDKIAAGLSAKLMPQIETFCTNLIDKKFKELEPAREIASGVMSSAGGTLPQQNTSPPVDLNGILKQIGINIPNNNGTPPDQNSTNPLAALLGGAAGGTGGIMGLLELLKAFGVLPNSQQGGMNGNMMMELMYRAFMEDIAFSSAIKKGAVLHYLKNPEDVQQYMNTSNAFVSQPLDSAAKLVSGNNVQGNSR